MNVPPSGKIPKSSSADVLCRGSAVSPSSPTSSTPPVSETQAQPAEGKEIFNKHCSRCHPGGGGGIGPSLKKSTLLDFSMKFKARHGADTMPQFSTVQLTDEQLNAVVRIYKDIEMKRLTKKLITTLNWRRMWTKFRDASLAHFF
jgi:mono/diheme cytochrome c family protein